LRPSGSAGEISQSSEGQSDQDQGSPDVDDEAEARGAVGAQVYPEAGGVELSQRSEQKQVGRDRDEAERFSGSSFPGLGPAGQVVVRDETGPQNGHVLHLQPGIRHRQFPHTRAQVYGGK